MTRAALQKQGYNLSESHPTKCSSRPPRPFAKTALAPCVRLRVFSFQNLSVDVTASLFLGAASSGLLPYPFFAWRMRASTWLQPGIHQKAWCCIQDLLSTEPSKTMNGEYCESSNEMRRTAQTLKTYLTNFLVMALLNGSQSSVKFVF